MSHIETIETDVFPGVGDIEGLIEEIGVQELRQLLKQKGVFISARKESLASLVARYYLDREFYREAFNRVRRKEYGVALTGIRMRCDNLEKLYDSVYESRNDPIANNRYRPRFVSVDKVSENELRVGIQYERINPRFAMFHRREIYSVNAEIKIIDGIAEISAFQAASSDSIVVRDLAHHLAKKVGSELVAIDLSSIPVARRVDLFDELLKDSTKLDWRIDKCCGLAIRNGSDEDEERTLKDSDTEVLHSAILDGQNLRDHKIVKDLVAQTYYFSTASFYTYKVISQDYQVRVKVDFKLNPTVLVVTAESARQYAKDGSDTPEIKVIEKAIGSECVRYFWDRVHELFRLQHAHSQQKAKQVVRKH